MVALKGVEAEAEAFLEWCDQLWDDHP